MNNGLDFSVVQGTETIRITHGAFPGGYFTYRIPEAIGDVNREVWTASPRTAVHPEWKPAAGGGWYYSWERDGLLRYSALAKRNQHAVDVHMTLKNLGDKPWRDSFSFSCFNFRNMPEFADFDGSRVFVKLDGRYAPITTIARKDSPRPTIQMWYVAGGPRGLGFVESFQAAPEVYTDGVLAARSWDGKHLIAVASDKPLFLFNNMEFSCIHCCPSFGPLEPGQEGRALHRAYVLPETRIAELDQMLAQELPNYAG